MNTNTYFVYVLTNKTNTVLYTGVTNDLYRRLEEHRNGTNINAFTHKYKVNKLVYYESCGEVESAILREKQIKAGSRSKKLALIESMNPQWRDLSEDWAE